MRNKDQKNNIMFKKTKVKLDLLKNVKPPTRCPTKILYTGNKSVKIFNIILPHFTKPISYRNVKHPYQNI